MEFMQKIAVFFRRFARQEAIGILLLMAAMAVAAEPVLPALRPHPRLHLTDADLATFKVAMQAENQAGDPTRLRLQQYILKTADLIVQQPAGIPLADPNFDKADRIAQKRIIFCAMAYRLSQPGGVKAAAGSVARGYARRALDEMQYYCDQLTDWSLPNGPFSVADLGHGFALGYDWLYVEMTSQERTAMARVMFERGLLPYAAKGAINPSTHAFEPVRDASGLIVFDDFSTSWANGAQVHNAGCLAVAFAMGNELPDAALYAARVIDRAPSALLVSAGEYGPDGAYGEGPGYWSYGTENYMAAIGMLRSAVTDTAFQASRVDPLEQVPGLNKTAYFRYNLRSAGGPNFSFADSANDSDHTRSYDLGWPSTFAITRLLQVPGTDAQQMRFVAAHNRLDLENKVNSDYLTGEPSIIPGGRFFSLRAFSSGVFFPLWVANFPAPAPTGAIPFLPLQYRTRGQPLNVSDSGRNTAEIATMMDRAGDPAALWVGIKAGANGINHSHADLGSFFLVSDGECWADDLGAGDYSLDGYSGLQNDSKRWAYFLTGIQSHNVPAPRSITSNAWVNQFVPALAPIVAFDSTASQAFTVVDLTQVYRQVDLATEISRPLAQRIQRGFRMLDRPVAGSGDHGRLLVVDEAEGLPVDLGFNWRLVTRATISLSANGRAASLTRDGKTMVVSVLAPASATFSVFTNVQNVPLQPGDGAPVPAANVLEIRLPPGADPVRLATLFEPGSAPPRANPPVEALTTWVPVNPDPPVITSRPIATLASGQAFSYQITASNSPTTFSATNLPAGLTIDSRTGLISGTPSIVDQRDVVITASNRNGSGTAILDLGPVPTITSSTLVTFPTTQRPQYRVSASFNPSEFLVLDIPTGWTFSTYSGLLSAPGSGPWPLGSTLVTVRARNQHGLSIPLQVTLLSGNPPAITTQPVNQAVVSGSTATFTIQATGSPTPTYQWLRNGAAIPGATLATYITRPTMPDDQGAQYTCVVTNGVGVGSVTSHAAVLNVLTVPIIIQQPTGVQVTAGTAATFTVIASGNPAPTYQWKRSGVDISGATRASYSIPRTTGLDDGAQFTCVVLNAAGSVVSTPALLTVYTPPVITIQPIATTVVAGQPATFSITAMGKPLPSYQWRRDGVAVAGATGSSFTLTTSAAGDDGAQISCIVTNGVGVGTVVSNTVTLGVQYAPVVLVQPEAAAVTVGQRATFRIVARGNPAPTYLWRVGTAEIPTATTSTYTTANAVSGDSGQIFSCVVKNSIGSTASAGATLTVGSASGGAAPAIATQPAPRTVSLGQPAEFRVAATGVMLTYQWRKNGVPIPDATTANLTIPATALADNGSFISCLVSNPSGHVVSAAVALTVQVAPEFQTQPASQSVVIGQVAIFTAVVSGNPAVTYQWQRNGSVITGATKSTYVTPAAQLSDSGAQYTCVATNLLGTAISTPATLIVQPGLTITAQPEAVSVTAGQAASFRVVAIGSPPLTYQWFRGGVAISGATAATYAIAATAADDHGALLTCIVGNNVSSITSEPVILTVTYGPRILRQPASQSVAPGQPATFSIIADGNPAPTYQWYQGTSPIAGATESSYTTSPVALADAGQTYTCKVTNTIQTNASLSARLTVTTGSIGMPPSITTQSADVALHPGQPASFSVTAEGTGVLSFQWWRSGSTISGATAASYVVPRVSLADDGALFSCEVSNDLGRVVSNAARLTVTATPVIIRQPVAQQVSVGGAATFSLTVEANPPPAYQWRRNGVPIPGAVDPNWTMPNVLAADDQAVIDCVVVNSEGSVTSTPVVLSVTRGTLAGGDQVLANGGGGSGCGMGSGFVLMLGFLVTVAARICLASPRIRIAARG